MKRTRNLTGRFKQIVENAFDFLEHSARDIGRQPKYSLINFYTAVELFLKARLLSEHWSLVVAKDPDRNRFAKGDFVSVGFDVACERLDKVLLSPISSQAKQNFEAVRRHRNILVHFVHVEIAENEIREQIVREQLRAWHELKYLLLQQWEEIFRDYGTRIASLDQTLQSHRQYLQAKYDNLLPKIKSELANGKTFVQCDVCGFNSFKLTSLLKDLHEGDCLLCNNFEKWINYSCEFCNSKSKLTEGGSFSCPDCESKEGEARIVERLDENVVTPDNYFETATPANCGECEGYHSVITYGAELLCIVCFDKSQRVQWCEHCGEPSTGDMDDSGYYGCGACDGMAGRLRDD
jgi:hypothetical protein